ncbi:MAG: LPD7 domain-containing protein, partial [Bilophila sp.]
ESLIGWVQRTCLAELNSAKSWAELHEVLAQHGLQLKERGNGLTLSSGTLHVKPSSVDRGLSKGRLEKRLGVFRAKGAQAQSVPNRKPSTEAKHYTRQPLRHNSFDSKPLWEQYTAELTRSDASREQALLKARTQRDAAFDQAGKAAGVRNTLIRYATSGVLKRVLYWQSRSNLRKKQEEIRKNYQEERKQIYAAHPHDNWNNWLLKQAENGNAEALACLRMRPRAQAAGNRITGVRLNTRTQTVRPEKVTRKGGLLFSGGILDTGDALLFSNMQDAVVKSGLELARTTFGKTLSVEGSEAFRAQVVRAAVGLSVVFTDPILERARREHVLLQQRTAPQKQTLRGRE